MHDPPGLEISYRLLDDVANLVDLPVEFLLPVQKLAMGGFPDRRDHVVSDVSFIADPVAGVNRQQDFGFAQAIRVVVVSINRVRNPCQSAAECAGDLNVHACGLVLAGVQLRCEAHDQHGSRVPSTMYCVRPSSSSAVGTYSLSTLPSNGVTP